MVNHHGSTSPEISQEAASNTQTSVSQQPELTGRAIVIGIVVGSLLCFTNCYFGLQSSWISMSSLQSALVGYGLMKLLPRTSDTGSLASPSGVIRPRSRFWAWFGEGRFTAQENVVLQATAVALGSMPLTTGLIGVVPALAQIRPAKDHGAEPVKLQGGPLLLWGAALAFFGVFFASPLRKRVIIKEKLVFPSGTATAHLISVLHNEKLREDPAAASKTGGVTRGSTAYRRSRNHRNDDESPSETQRLLSDDHRQPDEETDPSSRRATWQNWTALLWSFGVSLLFTFSSALFPALYALPVFDVLPPHNLASRWGWYFTPSLSYIGQGVIMGLHTTASMMAGAIFGWALLSPLAHHSGWTDGAPMDAEDGAKGWILWISLAIMTAESFVGLLVILLSGLGTSNSRGSEADRVPDEATDEPVSRLPQKAVIVGGIIASSTLAVFSFWFLFGVEGIEPYTTVIAIVVAFALSVLAVRALGSTDLNPVAALGKISQLLFALLQPHNIVANMIAGGISEAGAMQAGELMQDFKTGHLTHASPRSQFYGQIIGSCTGIFVSSFAYQLYVKTYSIPSSSFPAPAASMWLNFARLVNNGEIPRHSKEWMIGCAVVFAISGTIKALAQAEGLKRRTGEAGAAWERWSMYLPSGVAFAVGILNTPNFSIARFIGGLVTFWWHRSHANSRKSDDAKVLIIVVASGFVLGEGAGSIVNLFAKQAGLQPISCGGCRGSCGGGC